MLEADQVRGSDIQNPSWDAHQLQAYLISLRYGREALIPISRYPVSINLPEDLHHALNEMRQETKDGYERFRLIGCKDDELYVQQASFKGDRTRIPRYVGKDARWQAEQEGVVDIIGDIHSHPVGAVEIIYRRLIHVIGKQFEVFSPGDLYRLISAFQFQPTEWLVEGDKNLFVLRTQETRELPRNLLVAETEGQFTIKWLEQIGFKYSPKAVGLTRTLRTLFWPDYPRVNRLIAEEHNLVLYKGSSNDCLIRISP